MESILLEKGYSLLTQSIALFTIMNTISAGAIMLTLVPQNISHKALKSIALKNTKAVFVSMILLFAIGVYMFDIFGILIQLAIRLPSIISFKMISSPLRFDFIISIYTGFKTSTIV